MTAAAPHLTIRPASIDDLPVIATRIRYWADRRVLLPVETPDLTPSATHRPCPKCGNIVFATKPVCADCGTRVYFSRPA